MANADAPFGFRPINMDGTPYNGATLKCSVSAADATAIFIGDAVSTDGSSNGGYPGVTQSATTEAVFGVVTAFEADPATSLQDQYRKALTLRYCQVALADRAYFECQADGADASLPAAASGLNAEFAVTAGSTAYGISKTEINAGSENTTADLDLMLIMPVDRADNDVTLANANWIVKFNDPQTATPDRTGV